MGSTMDTGCCLTVSTGSVMNTSHRSAVAPRAASGGGVAVVAPASAAMPRPDWTTEEARGRAASPRDRVPSLQRLIIRRRRRCPSTHGAGVTPGLSAIQLVFEKMELALLPRSRYGS